MTPKLPSIGAHLHPVRVQLKTVLWNVIAERNASTERKRLPVTSERTAVWAHSPGEKVASSPVVIL